MSNFVTLLDILHGIVYSNNRECDTMIYPSIDKLLNIVDSKYELVHIAARRSKEISRDGYLQMPESEYKSKKNIGRALEEVAEGLLEVKKRD
jgi:DNA-directed RNA polymerase subunit omega